MALLTASTSAGVCDPSSLFTEFDAINAANTEYLAIGDLNNDSILDLATAKWFQGSVVSILLGNGDGTFLAHQTIDMGDDDPRAIAIGDLNNDGAPDLAVPNRDAQNVRLLLGTGHGTFSLDLFLPTGVGFPREISLADLNADGNIDIVVTNTMNGAADTASVFLGNGDATFQPFQNFDIGERPDSLAIGDLNNDGVPDIATANLDSDDVSVLFGNGDGTFQPQLSLDTFNQPSALAIGDMNNDGMPDLAVTFQANESARVILSGGDGTFQNRLRADVGIDPTSVVIGDVNLDGTPDLVVSNVASGDLSLLIGDGDGTFQSEHRVNIGNGSAPNSLVIGDLNGDASPDIALTVRGDFNSHFVLSYLNQCAGTALCHGDCDTNGSVNFSDLVAILAQFGGNSPACDADASGTVNFSDLVAALSLFGPCPN